MVSPSELRSVQDVLFSPSAFSGNEILNTNERGNGFAFHDDDYKMLSEKIEVTIRNKQESRISNP